MTDLRQAAQQALEALEAITRSVQSDHQAEIAEDAITALKNALEQQAKTPPEWPLVKNILDEYGLDAIAFVAEFKAAQRPWVGLTEEDWGWVADRKGTSLDSFDQGAAWTQQRLKELNK